MKHPRASVITPVYNSAKTVVQFLDSLKQQSMVGTLELIIIDDGSTDSTQSLLSNWQSNHPEITITFLTQNHLGPALARNFGASKANSDILVFLDSDMTFAPDCIEKLISPIIQGKTIGTSTKAELVSNWNKPYARFWNYQYTKQTSKVRVNQRQKDDRVFRAILKSAFIEVGGFDHVGYTDDWTLSQKLKIKATFVDNATIYHKNPETVEEVVAQAIWVGKRNYKFGELGRLWAFLRANPLFSLIVGLYQAVMVRDIGFLPFKFIYNAGIQGGIIFKWLGQERGK